MFEGQFNRAKLGEARESEHLRAFRWTDLVARLAATRDLRDELARHGEGDFRAFAHVRREGGEGKHPVNHDALSDGKDRIVSLDATADDAVQGDREKE